MTIKKYDSSKYNVTTNLATSMEPAPALKKSVSSFTSGFERIPIQISFTQI